VPRKEGVIMKTNTTPRKVVSIATAPKCSCGFTPLFIDSSVWVDREGNKLPGVVPVSMTINGINHSVEKCGTELKQK
jgi:hypothetical protein